MIITVKAARVNVKMSQDEVAQALNMSLNGYKRKENGQRRFYADELAKLSKLFGVSMLNFFEAQCHQETQQGA